MEKIEFKAYAKAVEIGQEVDKLNEFPTPLYSQSEIESAKKFEAYLKLSDKYSHTDKYKALWDQKSR
jgi:hypothetical protein